MDIYPLTIVKDRYSGTYSRGKFLAFNLQPWDVPEGIAKNDPETMKFWANNKDYKIGKGDTIREARNDLEEQLLLE